MTRNTLTQLADLVDELTQPRQHTERIWDRDKHRNKRLRRAWTTVRPGLLTQLVEAITEATPGPTDGTGHTIPASRPPGCWEAAARHSEITAGAAFWCWELDLDQRDTVEGNLHALVGAYPALNEDIQARLLAAVRRWHTLAATMTGWATESFRPDVPCPVCDRHGVLRVHLDRDAGFCTNHDCKATWNADTIGVLRDYIRTMSDAPTRERRPRIRSGRQGNGGWLTPPNS